MPQQHPIFDDIHGGNLEAVRRRVRADAAVMEERGEGYRRTPLIYAILMCKTAIALWLIEHRMTWTLATRMDGRRSTWRAWKARCRS